VFGIALAATGLQMVLYLLLRVPPWVSYLIGPFVLNALFAWVATDALKRVRLRLRGAVTAVWGLSLAFLTLGTLWQVHRDGWDRGSMSPTLANQVAVARALNRYSDASVRTDVLLYQQYPHAIQSLRLLFPPDPARPRVESGRLVIRYRPAAAGGRGSEIELVEAASDADVPPDAKSIDVSPMPRWY
jgi:hypothetical protein